MRPVCVDPALEAVDLPTPNSQTKGVVRLLNPRCAFDSPLRIGISACLVGQQVRFDGGHKRDSMLMEIFGADVEWVPVCPEVESGMSTPREPLRLERDG